MDELPASQYLEWLRYDRECPSLTGDILDVLMAQLCYVVASAGGCKDVTPDHFRLFLPPPPPPDPEHTRMILKQLGFKEKKPNDQD